MKEEEDVFEEVVKNYDKMIWQVANRCKKSVKTEYETEELYQFGLFGLWKAFQNFDQKKGNNFGTYAYINIKGYIHNGINRLKEANLSRADVKKKEDVGQLLQMKEEKSWSWKETKKRSGLSSEDWNEAVKWNKSDISIYSDLPNKHKFEEGLELIELIPGEMGIEEKIIEKESIEEFFTGLDQIEKEIIKFRFLIGYNKKEMSELLKMPKTSYFRREQELLEKIKIKRPLPV